MKVSSEASRKELLPSAYTNLSYLYSKTKKYDSAYVYSQKALEFIDVNDTYKLAFTYHDIGYLLAEQGKYSEAIEQYKKALSYCKGESFYDKKLEVLKVFPRLMEMQEIAKCTLLFTAVPKIISKRNSEKPTCCK